MYYNTITVCFFFFCKLWCFMMKGCSYTHLCLHHKAPPASHTRHKSKHIHDILHTDLLQLCEESNESPCPPHTSTAMNHNRSSVGGISSNHFTHKVKQRRWILRYTMIRPDSVMELAQNSLLLRALFVNGKGADCVVS